jgi:hypothetical protein
MPTHAIQHPLADDPGAKRLPAQAALREAAADAIREASPLIRTFHRGVYVIGRERDAEARQRAIEVVENLPETIVWDMVSVFCDDKVHHRYHLRCYKRTSNPLTEAKRLASAVAFSTGVTMLAGGHNGISVGYEETTEDLTLRSEWKKRRMSDPADEDA